MAGSHLAHRVFLQAPVFLPQQKSASPNSNLIRIEDLHEKPDVASSLNKMLTVNYFFFS